MSTPRERLRRMESTRSVRSRSSQGSLSRKLSLDSIKEEQKQSLSGDEVSYDLSSFPITDDGNAEEETNDDEIEFEDEDETDSASQSSKKELEARPEIASEQTRQILTLAVGVKVFLVVATLLAAAAIYFNLRWEEMDQFESLVKDHSTKVLDSFRSHLMLSLTQLDNFGVAYTSEVEMSEMEWPFVSLPGFQYRGASAMSAMLLKHLSFSPVVSSSQRPHWETYTIGSTSWIPNDSALQPVENIFEISRIDNGRYRNLQSEKTEFQVDKQLDSENQAAPSAMPQNNPTSPPSGDITFPSQKNGSESIEKPQLPLPSDDFFTLPPSAEEFVYPRPGEPVEYINGVATTIYRQDSEDGPVVESYDGAIFVPYWQTTPTVPQLVKYNLLSHDIFSREVEETIGTAEITVGNVVVFSEALLALFNPSSLRDEPASQLYVPVFSDFSSSRTVMGLITGIIQWSNFLENSLPPTTDEPLVCVLQNPCGSDQTVSYELVGKQATFLGFGDLHNSKFDHLVGTYTDGGLSEYNSDATASQPYRTFSGVGINQDYCPFTLRVYPTKTMEDKYITGKPLYYTIAVFFTFLLTVLMLALLSYLQERRHKLVLETAIQTNAVVSSLFPAVVRDRLLGGKGSHLQAESAKLRLKSYLDKGQKKGKMGSKPIADLFPDTTVLFADISGFTAWSSVREPHQVFTLLETVYQAFDRIAKKRSVFKVETIGDCYVAVTGLPDPQEDHAIIMARFAMECMQRMNIMSKKLERQLGPDTGDLRMRFGMHSGPTTAGVLRGEKSRFQLFGDTVNTASRMESTGKPNHIQCSQTTADLIIAGGKSHWVNPRAEIVKAKGKGEIQTYWIDHRAKSMDPLDESCDFGNTKRSLMTSARDMLTRGDIGISGRSLVWGDSKNFEHMATESEHNRHQRLIDWNVNLLKGLLKQIVDNRARRDYSKFNLVQSQRKMGTGTNPRNQVTEAIVMPHFDSRTAKAQVRQDSSLGFDLSSSVVAQLKSYVTAICMLYHDDNPFHNFEHASHVTMSANKLLKRVVAPDEVFDRKSSMRRLASNLHEYTYGITSDPLTQFAIIFSALIHDVDHCGVSNSQLVKEGTTTSEKYEGKSVAEQNSIDLAWGLLMDPEYKDLQTAIYANENEFRRFRQLVVNSVIATDIFDKDLKDLRNRR